MIIHEPELLTHDDHTILFSRIEMENKAAGLPDFLWYRTPSQYAPFLSLHSDPFLIPGLLAGMHFKEDIHVRGCVSPKLAYHLEEYQFLLHFRMPEAVSPVQVHYDCLAPLNASPVAVGSTFSGGVDSLFTIWKHLPENQAVPGYHISHAIFLLGFDILNRDHARYHALYRRYREALQQINIELIPLETNLVSLIVPRMKFIQFDGPVLIGAAQAFGNLFSSFIIPASSDYLQLKKWISSSDSLSDPFLSTDSMDIIHHGTDYTRVEKIKGIIDWDIAHSYLRVCQQLITPLDNINCSRCEKCLRTMIPIYALGKMDKFRTFEKPLKKNSELFWWARKFNPALDFINQTFQFSRVHKPTILPWLAFAAAMGYVRYWMIRSIPQFFHPLLRHIGMYNDPYAVENAHENPEVIEVVRRMG